MPNLLRRDQIVTVPEPIRPCWERRSEIGEECHRLGRDEQRPTERVDQAVLKADRGTFVRQQIEARVHKPDRRRRLPVVGGCRKHDGDPMGGGHAGVHGDDAVRPLERVGRHVCDDPGQHGAGTIALLDTRAVLEQHPLLVVERADLVTGRGILSGLVAPCTEQLRSCRFNVRHVGGQREAVLHRTEAGSPSVCGNGKGCAPHRRPDMLERPGGNSPGARRWRGGIRSRRGSATRGTCSSGP